MIISTRSQILPQTAILPSALPQVSRKQQKKNTEAVKKSLELQKKTHELLQKQIEQQKVLLYLVDDLSHCSVHFS